MSRAYYALFNVLVPPHEFTFNQVSSNSVFKPLTPEELMQAEEEYYANNKPRAAKRTE
ncbi:MAG: hypothetical protein GY753_11910 [Gammaproteobacteria bacterium]|nr:hypothetical protein [Gammaproteobacteria bacterium]